MLSVSRRALPVAVSITYRSGGRCGPCQMSAAWRPSGDRVSALPSRGVGSVRELRFGQVGARLEVAQAYARPALIVLEPAEHASVLGHRELLDVSLRRLHPLQPALETEECEPGELAPLVGQEVEPRAVGRPRPGEVGRLLVVRSELARLARSRRRRDGSRCRWCSGSRVRAAAARRVTTTRGTAYISPPKSLSTLPSSVAQPDVHVVATRELAAKASCVPSGDHAARARRNAGPAARPSTARASRRRPGASRAGGTRRRPGRRSGRWSCRRAWAPPSGRCSPSKAVSCC